MSILETKQKIENLSKKIEIFSQKVDDVKENQMEILD
jgi:hypothetical protein